MPFAQTQSTAYQAFLSQYTEDLRAGLYAIAKQYHSKANIEVVDIYTQFRQVIANPEDYNLDPAVIATACLKGAYGESERSLCDDPDSHLWFDAYHPSRIGHRIVASVFQDVLKEWA
jgi:phospholipase/lecithinase/hemolysin